MVMLTDVSSCSLGDKLLHPMPIDMDSWTCHVCYHFMQRRSYVPLDDESDDHSQRVLLSVNSWL
ncbi:hypothetical protein DsansV1_C42g0238111 [Dioscorea sansibarensis]